MFVCTALNTGRVGAPDAGTDATMASMPRRSRVGVRVTRVRVVVLSVIGPRNGCGAGSTMVRLGTPARDVRGAVTSQSTVGAADSGRGAVRYMWDEMELEAEVLLRVTADD